MQSFALILAAALVGSVAALPASGIFSRAVAFCGNNDRCEKADAQHVINNMLDMGERRFDVNTQWTSLNYYADCNIYAHSGSGEASGHANAVGGSAQTIYNSCVEGALVSGAITVAPNLYIYMGTRPPN